MTSVQQPHTTSNPTPAETAYTKALEHAEAAWLICERLNDRQNAATLKTAISGMYDSRDNLKRPWTADEILRREA